MFKIAHSEFGSGIKRCVIIRYNFIEISGKHFQILLCDLISSLNVLSFLILYFILEADLEWLQKLRKGNSFALEMTNQFFTLSQQELSGELIKKTLQHRLPMVS